MSINTFNKDQHCRVDINWKLHMKSGDKWKCPVTEQGHWTEPGPVCRRHSDVIRVMSFYISCSMLFPSYIWWWRSHCCTVNVFYTAVRTSSSVVLLIKHKYWFVPWLWNIDKPHVSGVFRRQRRDRNMAALVHTAESLPAAVGTLNNRVKVSLTAESEIWVMELPASVLQRVSSQLTDSDLLKFSECFLPPGLLRAILLP